MEKNYNKFRLFVGSCLALLVTSLTFAMRAKIEEVFGPVSDGGIFGLSKEAIGWAFGPAFWGFTVAMVAGGFLIDIVKTKSVVWAAFFLHLIGAVAFIMAKDKETLFLANIFIGLGNGCVEAAFNPLIATIYKDNKTTMLNRFHVWFPGGIVLGSLLAYLMMDTMGINWQIYIGILFIPLAIYGFLFMGQKIPETERVSSGITYKGMLDATGAPVTLIASMTLMLLLAINVVKFPEGWMYLAVIGAVVVVSAVEALLIRKTSMIFPIMFTFMLLTASTELVTTQWVNALLSQAGVSPMLMLALITGIMAVGRFFAGGLVHRLNPVGVLLLSSVFSALGIYALSMVNAPAMVIVSSVIFAVGVTYFWPTMLGFVAEYIPKSGALGLSLLGGAGMVSVAMFLPVMGRIMEENNEQVALQSIGALPVILIIGFAILYSVYRKRKPESL
ncbi:MFS transporter [Labilibacter marinus]|uniref:MFS transporter n=1 Tax=Labilibacter marinus TaxID=1477105 RepID=UPI00094F4C83|nr:MFS transporter [Labilibacter marinus]